MSVNIKEYCVTMPDGTMYCFDAEDVCWYHLNKKRVALADVPAEAVKGVLLLAEKKEIGDGNGHNT